MFNGIKGIDTAVAHARGYSSPDEMKQAEQRSEKMRGLAKRGAQKRRENEDPVQLALKAREAGCNDARSVAGWIQRYKAGGLKAANAGPDDRQTELERQPSKLPSFSRIAGR